MCEAARAASSLGHLSSSICEWQYSGSVDPATFEGDRKTEPELMTSFYEGEAGSDIMRIQPKQGDAILFTPMRPWMQTDGRAQSARRVSCHETPVTLRRTRRRGESRAAVTRGICTRTCDIGSTIDKIGAAAAARGRRGRRGDGGGSDGAVMGVPANEPI